MKKYSFVIPTYQNKTILKNTLEALNHQKRDGQADYEVIVVDDGSTDDTFGYIKNINRSYDLKYIYLERGENSSRSRARNHGWRAAEGEIVVFIDSDILVRENYLKELDRCFGESRDILVLGLRLMLPESISYESVLDGSVFKNYGFNVKKREMLEIRHFIFNRFSYNISAYRYPWLFVFTCNAAVPKRLLQKTGGFDENFTGWGIEDNELGLRLQMEGVKIICNSRLETLHQFHKNDADERSLDKNIRYFLDKHPGALSDIPEQQAFDLFKGRARIDLTINDGQVLRREIIEFKDRSQLQDIKDVVLEASSTQGTELIIRDHTEDIDLELWVQLLGKRNSTPKFFPASRQLENIGGAARGG